MKSFIFQDCTLEQRAQQLEQLAASKEVLRYDRQLTEAEIDTESKHIAKLYKDLCEVEAEKAAANKRFGEEIKSIRAQIEVSADTLQNGQKEVSETCYKFIDIDAREVGFYNRFGELVRVRPAQDNDLQLDMFGNNDVAAQHEVVGALPGESQQPEDKNAGIEEAQVVEDGDPKDDEEEVNSIFD